MAEKNPLPSSLGGYTHEAAFDSGFLQVSEIHRIHYAQYGKQDGKPEKILHIIWGVFTVRRSEIDWFYRDGASHVFPEAFEEFLSMLPPDQRQNPVPAYYKLMTSEDPAMVLAAAKAFSRWEMTAVQLFIDPKNVNKVDTDEAWALSHSILESHYFVNDCFLDEGQLLKKANIDRIRDIPATIVQGRYDIVCPFKTAFDLHKAWPEANFIIVPDAGHLVEEQGIYKALVEASDRYAQL